MGRYRKPRLSSKVVQSDQARELLQGDTPARIKIALRLALRGGKASRRSCLNCGKVGIACKVWSEVEDWRVESRESTSIKVYWLCQRCNAQFGEGLPDHLQGRLRGG